MPVSRYLPSVEQIWQAAIAAAGPALAAIIGFFKVERGSRIARRLRQHASLAKQLPEGSASRAALEELLAFEAGELRDREKKRAGRRVNATNVVLSGLLTVLSVVAIYFLAQWVIVASGSLWAIVAWVTTALVALFLALLVGAAWTTIFNPPAEKRT